jgi:hypothetical protein
MLGVTIGEKHSYNDFGLILSKKEISPPVPQTKLVTVPMRDGSIDLTESLTDDVKYNDRTITLTFSVVCSITEWAGKISEIENYMHGQRMNIIFDDDPGFYYVGRIAVNKWSSKKNIGTIVVKATVEPFKYDLLSAAVDWEWDTFSFDNGIINEMGQLVVDGTTTVTLLCRKKRMFPIFTASAAMTVTYKGETYSLKAGSQKVYDIFLCEGENVLTFTGSGTITIDYIGGSL